MFTPIIFAAEAEGFLSSDPQDVGVMPPRILLADGTPECGSGVNSMLISAFSRPCSHKRRGYSHPEDVVLTESDTPVYWAPPIGCRNASRSPMHFLSEGSGRVCEGAGIEDRSATGGSTRRLLASRFECTESQEVEWTCRFLRADGTHRDFPGSAVFAGPAAAARSSRCASSRLAFHVPVRGPEQASGPSGVRGFHDFFIQFPMSITPNCCAVTNTHAFGGVEHEGTT